MPKPMPSPSARSITNFERATCRRARIPCRTTPAGGGGGAAAHEADGAAGKGVVKKGGKLAAKIGMAIVEGLIPDPLDAIGLMIEFAGSYTEAIGVSERMMDGERWRPSGKSCGKS